MTNWLRFNENCQTKTPAEQKPEKLRGKQEELTIITNNMNEGLVLLNGQQNVLFINESAAKIFGFSAKEVVGRNILTVDRAQEVQDLLQKVSQAGKGEGLYEKDGHFTSFPAVV